MKYRPDIDGLRALAVTSVVLYHFDVLAISGGFVGVDIFFVISGYLITSIIWKELSESRFTITGFYERRFRRLLPALLAVLGATLLAAWFLILPSDFDALGRGGFFTAFFLSNFFFYGEVDYFNEAAALNPLLHTWSLAVEEQFYIVLPVLLILLQRFKQQTVFILIGIISILSLGVSVWLVQADPPAAFYLLPSRAWELLAGSLVALRPLNGDRPRLASALGLGGAGLIVWTFFTLAENSSFPGLNAVPPVLGSVMLIIAGQLGGGPVTSLISQQPFVFIGKISYSWYLWHWPLIALYAYLGVADYAPEIKWILLIASFLIATASWRFVEQPWRHKTKERPAYIAVGAGLAASVAAGGVFALVALTDGAPGRVPDAVLAHDKARTDWPATTISCNNRSIAQVRRGDVCKAGDPDAPVTFAILGDSNGDVTWPAMSAAMAEHGKAGLVFTRNSCPILIGVTRYANITDCDAFIEASTAYIRGNADIETVIIMGRWAWYVEPPLGTDTQRYLVRDRQVAPSVEGNRKNFAAAVADTVNYFGDREVIFIEPTPESHFPIAKQLALHAWNRHPVAPVIPAPEYYARKQFIGTSMRASGARVLDPGVALCGDDYCATLSDGEATLADTNHLTTAGAELLVPYFTEALNAETGRAEE